MFGSVTATNLPEMVQAFEPSSCPHWANVREASTKLSPEFPNPSNEILDILPSMFWLSNWRGSYCFSLDVLLVLTTEA